MTIQESVDKIYEDVNRNLPRIVADTVYDQFVVGQSAPLWVTVQVQAVRKDFYSVKIRNVAHKKTESFQWTGRQVINGLKLKLEQMGGYPNPYMESGLQ